MTVSYASVRKRIADTLCNFAIKHPQSNHGKPTIYLSREDLANKAGTAKETVIRTLSDFKEEGLISIDARKISLISPEKLRQIPN
jgi:CRP-like cAMP-binding protein